MINYKKGKLSFKHLGISIGENVKKTTIYIINWEPIASKESKKETLELEGEILVF